MDPTRRVAIDDHYEELLSRLPSPLASRLRDKFKEDEEAFIAAAVEACPSTSPNYWAKSSCKRCYGTGSQGTLLGTGEKVPCKCGDKRYLKWIRNFREEFNQERDNHDTTE